jgi:hypothetical protein
MRTPRSVSTLNPVSWLAAPKPTRIVHLLAPPRVDIELEDDDVSHTEEPEQIYRRIMARQ